jgi:hypothetical protein
MRCKGMGVVMSSTHILSLPFITTPIPLQRMSSTHILSLPFITTPIPLQRMSSTIL